MEHDVNPLGELGKRIAEVQDEALGAAGARAAARERFVTAVGRAARARAAWSQGARRRLALLAAVATVAAAAGAGTAVALRPPQATTAGAPLSVRAGDAAPTPAGPGAWFAAPALAPLSLAFSDGSAITLDPGAQLRMTASDAAGPRLVLERGAASVAVPAGNGSSWTVWAGPFAVKGSASRFSVGWDPTAEELRLSTIEGRTDVTGPCLDGGRAFTTGGHARLSCRAEPAPPARPPSPDASAARPAAPEAPAPVPPSTASPSTASPSTASPRPSAVRRSPREAPAARSVEQAPPASTRGPEAARPGPSASVSAAPAAPGWRVLFAAGRFAEALAAAEQVGFEAECSRGSPDDLLALGDLARFGSRERLALLALTTLRARFPADRRAATAAFVLGKLAFDARRDPAEAARWFGAYLDEAPDGELAAEAMGRLLEAHSQQGDAQTARAVARRYLARFPGGPHAQAARALLGAPSPGAPVLP